MILYKAVKNTIDAMTYEELLRRWRFAPVGDPMFQGDTGKYYSKRMFNLMAEVGHDEHVRASKSIGWDK